MKAKNEPNRNPKPRVERVAFQELGGANWRAGLFHEADDGEDTCPRCGEHIRPDEHVQTTCDGTVHPHCDDPEHDSDDWA